MLDQVTTHGHISWSELMTSDVKGAKEFYSKIFNWEFEEYDSDGDISYTLIKYKGEDEPFGGVFDKKDAFVENNEEIPSHWGNYITVDSISETIEKVKNLGGNIIVPATEIPEVGTFSVIQDPQGAVLSIMEYEGMEIDFDEDEDPFDD